MELTQIKYFIAVAQSENMSRAAKKLHISQPSLSKSINKLENELGCELFDRNGRHLSLNEQGERFLTGAHSLIQELDDTVFDIYEMTHSSVARLTIGITGTSSFLTKSLMDFSENHPEVRFRLQCNIEDFPVLDINKYDMLVYPEDERYKKFDGTFLMDDPYYLAVSYMHPFFQKYLIGESVPAKTVSIDDLINERFVFLRYADNSIETPYELCVGRAMYPQVYVFTNSSDMHRQVIAEGEVIGFVSSSCADSYTNDPRIRLFRIADKDFSRKLMVCFKRDKHLSATGKLLRSHIQETILEVNGSKNKSINYM